MRLVKDKTRMSSITHHFEQIEGSRMPMNRRLSYAQVFSCQQNGHYSRIGQNLKSPSCGRYLSNKQFKLKPEIDQRDNTSISYGKKADTKTTRRQQRIIERANNKFSGYGNSSSCYSKLPITLICISMMITILANYTPVSESVDCFKCSSRNGSNPACEDPFHNLNTTRITSPILPDPPPNVIYHTPCYAGKKGREGLFPASACIKLTGIFDITGETLVVRHCALDSGTLTQDTELARMSHCGKFQFEGDLLKGCVLACPEDACNSAPTALFTLDFILALVLAVSMASTFRLS